MVIPKSKPRPFVPVAKLPGAQALPAVQPLPATLDAPAVLVDFLAQLEHIFKTKDWTRLEPLLLKECWVKDQLALTSDIKTLRGRAVVLDGLKTLVPRADLHSLGLDPTRIEVVALPNGGWIEGRFTCKTMAPKALASGILHLVRNDDAWKLWILYIALDDFVDFPIRQIVDPGHSQDFTDGIYDPPTTTPTGPRGHITPHALPPSEPVDVLVVGGGQAGLSCAGYLQALGLTYHVVDRRPKVGDVWAQRYETVKQHLPKFCSHLPFVSVPKAYDLYLPGRQLAQYFQAYVRLLQLSVWTGVSMDTSRYDFEKGVWMVELSEVGEAKRQGTVWAKYLIFANGSAISGAEIPNVPEIPNLDVFQGQALHSVQFVNAEPWKDKAGVVIGCASTGHDIAEDMLERGLSSVTMVQRNPNIVIPRDFVEGVYGGFYNYDTPVPVSDTSYHSKPLAVVRVLVQMQLLRYFAERPGYYDDLSRAGFKRDESGDLVTYLVDRRAGHYVDCGCSKKIGDGKIKMKSDSEISAFTPTGLKFADGSEVSADVVVYCTGYRTANVRGIYAELGLMDAQSLSLLEEIGCSDSNGDFRGFWTNSSHPAVFFAGGDSQQARHFGRLIAFQIKLELEGQRLSKYSPAEVRVGHEI